MNQLTTSSAVRTNVLSSEPFCGYFYHKSLLWVACMSDPAGRLSLARGCVCVRRLVCPSLSSSAKPWYSFSPLTHELGVVSVLSRPLLPNVRWQAWEKLTKSSPFSTFSHFTIKCKNCSPKAQEASTSTAQSSLPWIWVSSSQNCIKTVPSFFFLLLCPNQGLNVKMLHGFVNDYVYMCSNNVIIF